MEPGHNTLNSSMELPQPQESTPSNPEQAATKPEAPASKAPIATPAPAPSAQPLTPLNSGAPTPATAAAAKPTPMNDPMIADDADLIEKEWVVKAKAIVEQTKDDPYEQNREMNKVKASYLKKRYNKDLKLSEN
ncbi:MAG TPA: hypothetical protein VLF87_02235 [Patescibacteria group bacterium]|nr:hypothetical protein [Patescibacteria group bacterium]